VCRTVETRIEYRGPRQCGKIVLWACPTCDAVSNRCGVHAATCPECRKKVCSNCTIGVEEAGSSWCRGCGFFCAECEHLFSHAERTVCDGPAPGVPCPSLGVDMCNGCEYQGRCVACDRKWCMQCDDAGDVLGDACEICQSEYCEECADALLMCECGNSFCAETCRGDGSLTWCRRCVEEGYDENPPWPH